MKSNKLILCVLFIHILCSQTVAQQKQLKAEKEMATTVETFRTAMIDGNKSILEKLVANELIY